MDIDLIRRLAIPADTKVVLCVLDGLGGLPGPRGRTELEAASTRHLDRLAEEGSLGQTLPVGYGITPGSGPGHLALFGYDPLTYEVGRGALEATGIDFELRPNDLAARGNFCTVDAEGLIVDRRAARIATEHTAELCAQLDAIDLPGVEVFVRPVKEHRFVLVLRGAGLSDQLTETDPQREGVAPLRASPIDPSDQPATSTAQLVNSFVAQARGILAGREQANDLTLRGWSHRPDLPQLPELWGLRAAALAVYPMYRGLARLVGMDILDAGDTLETQLAAAKEHWDNYDLLFVHYKYPDSAGEDGDFSRKQQAIHDFDLCLPRLMSLDPDVIIVTGDHSTPSVMAAHSWHPVPLLLWGRHVRTDRALRFNEHDCAAGGLGTFPAKEVLPIAFAHAGRLTKFGA